MIQSAIFDGPGRPFRIESTPRPDLAAGEVLVRVQLATVCGSDLHTASGARTEPTPCVLGHETVGVVEAVNGPVATVSGDVVNVGDRVVWAVAAGCGRCFFCAKDLPQKCESVRKYGHARVDAARGPAGGLASHVHLWPNTAVVRVPAELPDEVAAPAACATATVTAAVAAAGPLGGHALVVGAGMLGLTCAAVLRSAGMTVTVRDRDPVRVAAASRFGATDAPPPARGADAAFEFTGDPAATLAAIDSVRVGGIVVLVGAVFPAPPLVISAETIVRKLLTIRGVHNYAPADLQTAVAFLTANHTAYPFAELTPQLFPLSRVNEAFAYAAADRPYRVGVRPV